MYTKIIRSGDLIEIWNYEKEPFYRKQRGIRKPSVYRGRRWDNILRQKKSFSRLVRANLVGETPPSFLTLTMYQVMGIGSANKCLTAFFKRLQRDFRKAIRYIAVPEFQVRGAVHYHVLIWGLPEHVTLQESTTRLLQSRWLYGFCDLITTDGSPKLASYMAKYMSKSLSDIRLSSKKGYSSSRNLLRPMCLKGPIQTSYSDILDLSTDSQLDKQYIFTTQWLGQCVYKSYIV